MVPGAIACTGIHYLVKIAKNCAPTFIIFFFHSPLLIAWSRARAAVHSILWHTQAHLAVLVAKSF